MYRLCVFLMPFLLVGCYAPHANPPKEAAAGDAVAVSLEPTDATGSAYQVPVATYIKRYIVHADSLREVKIGEPFSGKLHGRAGPIVCVEMNAKNKAGSYTGLKRTAFLIEEQKVIESDYDTPVCKNRQLVAWPEMDTGSSRRGVAEGVVARKQQGMK
jgi:hypothetical protein